MARNKATNPKIDNSDPSNFPNARIKDNTGGNNGTPVNEQIYGDIHEFHAKLMRDAELTYNGLPDCANPDIGYQLVDALVAKAGKNDFVYVLSTTGGVIQIPAKLSILLDGEVLLCKAGFDKTTETTIKGSGPGVTTVAISSAFKTNDFLRLQKTGSTFSLTRLVDADNVNVIVGEKNYLKAATDLEEITGTSTTKATTPHSNLTAFEDRVNGDSSDTFLATTGQNGLLSKEDKAIINGFVNPTRNVGWFSGVDIGTGTPGELKPRSGDIVSAQVVSSAAYSGSGSETLFLITIAHAMDGTNYFVRSHYQSEGAILSDNNILCPVFKTLTSTTFQWSASEGESSGQSLKIHLEVVQIS